MFQNRKLLGAAFACAASVFAQSALADCSTPIAYNGSNSPSENFNTLAASGTTNPLSGLPSGFCAVESTGNTEYAADNGAGTSGNTYSYGTGTDADRALGSLASNSTIPSLGARLQNSSGAPLSAILVNYVGEQWRLGATGRTDRLDFQYSLDATSLTTGTWIDVNALDFVAPVTTGTLGALDGNQAANRTAISATISSLNWPAGGFLWLRWQDPNVGGADDGLALEDVVFGTPVDNPPTVTSTAPTSGASNVAVSTNIVINFSEPVQVVDPWLNLNCNGLNLTAGTNTPSNGGATWTLDPTDNADPGSNCTVTVFATEVSDIDGTPHNMAGNYQWSFTMAADTVPTVLSTYPTNNAVNVPVGATLTVTFSEAVTAPASAFTLTCASEMNPIPFTLGNSAFTTYQVDPTSNLPISDDCTLTIDGTQILDQDGATDPVGGEIRVQFQTGAGLSDYYSRVDASSCRALRSTLHGVIDDHAAVVYSDGDGSFTPGNPSTYDVYEIINDADEDPSNPNNILDIYRNESYPKHDSGAVNYNREHVWPNSQGFNDVLTLDGFPNPPYTDTHMLMASNTDYNARRGSRAFGACAGCTPDPTIFNAGNGVGGNAGTTEDDNFYSAADGGNGRYRVWNYRRGDLARAMMYMDIRYEGGRNSKNFQREPDLILTNDQAQITVTPSGSFVPVGYSGILSELIAWHNADSTITAPETLRNEIVYNVQGNRSPFVDHPEWVAIAFADPCTGPDLVAVDDDFQTTQNVVLNRNGPNDIGVLNDDKVYFGSTSLTASLGSINPIYGSVVVSPNGQFVYTPAQDFCGKATFTYNVTNGSANDTATAHIDVTCDAISPTAVADTPSAINEDSGLATFDVLANDTDPDGGLKQVTSVTQPGGGAGTAAVGAGGANVTFTPAANFCGNGVTFNYTLNGGSSTSVTFNVNCVDDAPVAVADTPTAINEDSGSNIFSVLSNDTDIDAGPKTVVSVTQPGGGAGTAAVGMAGANVTFTPAANFCGNGVSFNYTLNGGSSTAVTFNVTCVNDLPTTVGGVSNQTLNVGDSLNLNVSGNFSDVDNALAYSMTGAPASMTINPSTGVITGTATAGDAGASGTVYTVTVTASEPGPLTGTAQQQFTITVNPALGNAIFANSFE